jgi:hypothetical protein
MLRIVHAEAANEATKLIDDGDTAMNVLLTRNPVIIISKSLDELLSGPPLGNGLLSAAERAGTG